MKRAVATLLLVASIVAGVLALNLLAFLATPYGKTVSLTIEPRMTLDQILDRLEENGLLSNRPLFKFYLWAVGADKKIRAGEYEFAADLSPRRLLGLLLKGDFAKLRITIPEGWNVREVADFLGELVDPAEFRQKVADAALIQKLGLQVPQLEGYLYPDTYEIYRPQGAEEVIVKMVGRFREVFSELTSETLSGLTENQVVILASLIEKETGRPEERPVIASVFLNRLKGGMALASDPTVIYGMANFSGNLTRADLERPGPYNTYLNPGLPPTPICNPGREALRAALNPAVTDYLYFVSRNDGSHAFSRTIEEHARAVYQYQVHGLQEKLPITD